MNEEQLLKGKESIATMQMEKGTLSDEEDDQLDKIFQVGYDSSS